MALGAQPPDFFAATACGDIPRGEITIFVGMPLLSNLGVAGGQAGLWRCLARTLAGVYGASGAAPRLVGVGAISNCSFIVMALGAQPPDLFITAWGDLLGGAITIFVGMPFLGNLRIAGGQACL